MPALVSKMARALARALTGAALAPVTPAGVPEALFAQNENGVIYDPSNFASLFQDVAGTVPVTGVGQPVALMRDLSGNANHAVMPRNSRRPILQLSAGGKYYLATDGTQCMEHPNITAAELSAHVAALISGGTGAHRAVWSQRQGTSGDILYANDLNVFSYWTGHAAGWHELDNGAATLDTNFVASMTRSAALGKGLTAIAGYTSTPIEAVVESRQRGRIMAGADGLPVKPVVSATPKGVIPATTVTLAAYGGTPAASAATNRQAFRDALAALRTAGGGTLTVAAGTYDMGTASANGYIIEVDLLDNIMISGYGAILTFETGTGGIPILFHFPQCNNLNIFGMKFIDTGSDLTVTNHGMIAVAWGGYLGLTFSGFKMYDCEGEGLLALFRTEDGGHGVSGASIHATLTNCYYGVVSNYNGDNSEAFLTTNGCRRAFVGYGATGWNLVIDHTPTVAFQSNSFIELATDDTGLTVSGVNIWLTARGPWAFHNAAVGMQHQGGTTFQNVYVHIETVNVTSIAQFLWFVSYEPGIVASTTKLWENIQLAGVIDAASAAVVDNHMFLSDSDSTGASSVTLHDDLIEYQDFTGFPAYFTTAEIGSPAFFVPGRFYGAVIVDRELTVDEFTAVRAYLAEKAG